MILKTSMPDRRMRIKIKDLNTASMEIADSGIELEFRDGTLHAGDMIITPTKLIWNKGKTSKSGKQMNWPDFFALMKKQKP